MRGFAPLFFSFILDSHIDIINMDKRNETCFKSNVQKGWSV